MATSIESLLKYADSTISDALNDALSGRKISSMQGEALLGAKGLDFHLVGMVADKLRQRSVGDTVTYVVNRNVNFTNVCVKQCGFCAFSRDFREEQGYMLPVDEIVRRAKEAHDIGITEVCIQAGLPPDMKGDLYESICSAIKTEIPDMHIHGFSPEEVLYGALKNNTSVLEFLKRLKEAGVDTLPGTAAEILDQEMRDRISPGRITVKQWIDVIKSAHSLGIHTTCTMMFGHGESAGHQARHIELLRDIQDETRGFTEFVPLGFVHDEAPMYHNGKCKSTGASATDVMLTHAVSRIMLNDSIKNIQMSWVKEGQKMAQILLSWGANDFGGTLINESISTSAGSKHGQLLRPSQIRSLVRQIGRRAAERNTMYKILRTFDDNESHDLLDNADSTSFGSYFELVKAKQFRYKNDHVT
ncbi:MAG: 7,8-didemethyl-8-hydroxy-5-deazariboflavin synthase subunit CofH [Cenarchaeum symbiont of Oopsacas minuta]|nr:7,8-didemethyl-8-hydroxy-5-deazariboflavin synthase subunit CofH [Cenarchaeum symbiont of Oopsacas minuta]